MFKAAPAAPLARCLWLPNAPHGACGLRPVPARRRAAQGGQTARRSHRKRNDETPVVAVTRRCCFGFAPERAGAAEVQCH